MTEDELSIVISDIEHHKGRIRTEYEDLKEDYLAGDYRRHGLTKRETEDRLNKRNGEILGMEYALSYLYRKVEN